MSNRKLAKNIGSMSIAVFFSRISGLIRDIVMTSFFGTTYVADAFQVGYQIPNLLRKLFGEGALSAAFIPIYNEIGINKGKKYQLGFALNVLSLLVSLLVILCFLGIILAPVIVKILAPGFDDQTYRLTVKISRILFPYLIFIGLSSTLISILNSHDFFFIPGLSSAFLNIGIVGSLGIYVLLKENSLLENRIIYASIGVLCGGFLQVIINFPLLKKIGYHLKINLHSRSEAIKSVWKRFLPGVAGLAIRQVNLAVDLILASLLATGSIAALNYGNRLMQLPLGIFGVSAGVAVLPLYSKYFATEKWNELKESLHFSIISLSFIMLPITAIIAGLGKDFIRLLFMRGAFNVDSLNMTYKALLFYSLGLIFFSLNRLLIPIFYANKDTKTPVKISAFVVVLNIILNIILMQFMQHAGLAFATTISAIIHFFVLKHFLKKKIPQLIFPRIFFEINKILILSALLFTGLCLAGNLFLPTNFWSTIVRIAIFIFLSIVFFFLGSQILQIKFSKQIITKLWQRFHKK